MATVSFAGVGKVYRDGTRALDDFNLDVADGEFMVFVGPSGCGKTTALRMVAGLEDITEGEIRIGDRRRERAPPAETRRRDGLPELRALPAHDRLPEHRLRAEGAEDAAGARSSGGSRRRRGSSA